VRLIFYEFDLRHFIDDLNQNQRKRACGGAVGEKGESKTGVRIFWHQSHVSKT